MAANIIYIMGVSGSGKSTIGKLISTKTGLPFFDGDDFHPEANIAKMESGRPLTDADREAWLGNLNKLAQQELLHSGALIASSALKEKYRAILSRNIEDHTHWVYLEGDIETITGRMQEREKHFMPVSLLQSQFDTLEPPEYGVHVDISQEPETITNQIIEELEL